MPMATIRLDYGDNSYQIMRYEFDTIKDAVVYSRLVRMRKQARIQQMMNTPVDKRTSLYKELVAEGIVKQGEKIYHKDVEQLRKEAILYGQATG